MRRLTAKKRCSTPDADDEATCSDEKNITAVIRKDCALCMETKIDNELFQKQINAKEIAATEATAAIQAEEVEMKLRSRILKAKNILSEVQRETEKIWQLRLLSRRRKRRMQRLTRTAPHDRKRVEGAKREKTS